MMIVGEEEDALRSRVVARRGDRGTKGGVTPDVRTAAARSRCVCNTDHAYVSKEISVAIAAGATSSHRQT